MAGSTLQLRRVPGKPMVVRAGIAAIHRDVERSTAASNRNRIEPSLAEVEAQWAQAGGATETETHGDQRLLTQ